MILIKLVGIAWMLAWFFIIFKIVVKHINAGSSVSGSLFALAMVWLLVGFLPVLIAKFGWNYIS
ncbi:hypothetical protein PTT65_04265 [Serratia ureilytica]|uniref:hypothetical protein n=1 Tax=Serratia ureilytica TaxID=300181 RepID=UPI00313D87B9